MFIDIVNDSGVSTIHIGFAEFGHFVFVKSTHLFITSEFTFVTPYEVRYDAPITERALKSRDPIKSGWKIRTRFPFVAMLDIDFCILKIYTIKMRLYRHVNCDGRGFTERFLYG